MKNLTFKMLILVTILISSGLQASILQAPHDDGSLDITVENEKIIKGQLTVDDKKSFYVTEAQLKLTPCKNHPYLDISINSYYVIMKRVKGIKPERMITDHGHGGRSLDKDSLVLEYKRVHTGDDCKTFNKKEIITVLELKASESFRNDI